MSCTTETWQASIKADCQRSTPTRYFHRGLPQHYTYDSSPSPGPKPMSLHREIPRPNAKTTRHGPRTSKTGTATASVACSIIHSFIFAMTLLAGAPCFRLNRNRRCYPNLGDDPALSSTLFRYHRNGSPPNSTNAHTCRPRLRRVRNQLNILFDTRQGNRERLPLHYASPPSPCGVAAAAAATVKHTPQAGRIGSHVWV